MNLTEAIKQDNAKAKERENYNRLSELIRENPFAKEHWNVTRQIEAKEKYPELADLLYKCRGVALPTTVLDDLPDEFMAALKKYAKNTTDANAGKGAEE